MDLLQPTSAHVKPVKQRRRTKDERYVDDLCAQESIMPYAAFERLVREIIQNHNPELRVSREVVQQLRCASEAKLDEVMNLASKFAAHAGRQTMHTCDMRSATSALT